MRTVPGCSRRAARSARIATQRADPPFVARAPRLDALPHPDLLFRELLVELLLQHGLVRQPLVLLAQERGVVARPRREAPAVDLDDAGGEALEEGAIVRDEHHGARIVGEEVLQPGDCVDVEMVRRLVEQQDVRLRHQRPREQDPPAPAAGQRVDDGVGRQAQPGEDQFDPLLEPPAVTLLQFVLEPPEALERRVGRGFGDGHGGVVVRHHEIAQIAQPLGHHVEDREMRRRAARPGPGAPRAGSADATPSPQSGCCSPLRIAQQRRLAAPVPAEHAHTLARVDLQPHVVEQRQVSEGKRDAIERQQRHVSTLHRRPAPRHRRRVPSDQSEHDDGDDGRQQGAEQEANRVDGAVEVAVRAATGRPDSGHWR